MTVFQVLADFNKYPHSVVCVAIVVSVTRLVQGCLDSYFAYRTAVLAMTQGAKREINMRFGKAEIAISADCKAARRAYDALGGRPAGLGCGDGQSIQPQCLKGEAMHARTPRQAARKRVLKAMNLDRVIPEDESTFRDFEEQVPASTAAANASIVSHAGEDRRLDPAQRPAAS